MSVRKDTDTPMRAALLATEGPLAELAEWRTALENHRLGRWAESIAALEAHRVNKDGAHGWKPPRRRTVR
jgi:hypothetical protein